MRTAFDYGRGSLELELPDERLGAGAQVQLLEKHPVPAISDPDAALRAALETPIDTAPLRELARGRRNAVIVISDRTRPVPNATILPPLLDSLRAGGLPPEAVTVLVATGLHRPNTRDELAEMLGGELARSLRIEQHDAHDREAHADLGSVAGMPVLIDRRYLRSDLKILTGLIEPHLMAGYSGGRKAVCPGLAGVETVRVAHGPVMLEAQVGPGIVAGNPLHTALLEVMERAGADFLANVALDRQRRVAGVFCGHPVSAHAAGMNFVESESLVSIPEPADLVIVSAGGDPLDATFYQSIKGVSTASGIVRPGGVILLCAALTEGVGSASFEKLLRETREPRDFELRLEDDSFFAVDQWMVQHLCQALRRARVLMYTDGLPLAAARELMVEAQPSAEAAVARALDLLPPQPRIALLPQGPYVLATVNGNKRPLGAS